MGRGLPAPAPAVGGNADDNGAKTSWPELQGKPLIEALFVIRAQRQDITIKLLHADAPQPPDFDAHRVCLFFDASGIVVRTPVVG